MSSHKRILKSSTIVGGASIIEMVIGIAKVKFIAVLLGATGVGLLGLFQNIMGIGSTIAGCGLNNSGVRQLSSSSDAPALVTTIRRTLWWANIILGLVGFLVLWAFRDTVAKLVFEDTEYANEIGWLGIGIFFSLVAISQTAVLQGLRKISDLVRVKVIGAFVGALVGIGLVYLNGSDALIGFVIVTPIASSVVAMIYVARLPKLNVPLNLVELHDQWKAMLRFGIPLMGAGLLTLVTQLVTRSVILQTLGVEDSGYFQAAWAISMVYMGFVLKAMATDYFPRLSESIHDHKISRRLVNEQAEMAQLLSSPVLIFMMTFAPWVVTLLYSEEFMPAVELLRWQILGDVVKVACWPMGFILMAVGRSGLFFTMQLCWNAIYLTVVLIGIDEAGLIVAGIGFLVAYVFQFVMLYVLAMHSIDYKAERANFVFMLVVISSGSVVLWLSSVSRMLALGFGTVFFLLALYYSLSRLQELIDWKGWLQKKFNRI